jgi:type II secretory pathway pseudopilin PulG
VELLVVIGIIAVLIGILMPSLGKARESARRVACASNLRQMVTALHSYAADYKRYPALGEYPKGATGSSWSVHARLLPYLGMKELAGKIDLGRPFTAFPDVVRRRVAVFMCPSENQDTDRVEGGVTYWPTNYGACAGTWFVFDAARGTGGDGVFAPNRYLSASAVRDPDTVAFAEVRAFTPYLRDGGSPSAAGIPAPGAAGAVAGYGGSLRIDGGHTTWADGNVHQTGVTTTFPPNARVEYGSGGASLSVDFTSAREGRSTTGVTYAAITARSFHGKFANAALIDGSVRAIENDIPVERWRAMGTRAGRD